MIILKEEIETKGDSLETPDQEYTSAKTSINSGKLPAIFKMVDFKSGTINLDYGGGKWDNVEQVLAVKKVRNLVYDPYNRSAEHNAAVIKRVKQNGGADTITCSNVLNVIKEQNVRQVVIKNIYNLLKKDGEAYFTVYEGRADNVEGPTSAGYQLNKPTKDYIAEIKEIFPNVSRKGKLIVAKKN